MCGPSTAVLRSMQAACSVCWRCILEGSQDLMLALLLLFRCQQFLEPSGSRFRYVKAVNYKRSNAKVFNLPLTHLTTELPAGM